jgi:hypothetical protein
MNNANQYFENNSVTNKLYFTSDELAFFEEQEATAHASRLADKTIIARTREEVEIEIEEITNDNWLDELQYDPFGIPDLE